MMSEEAPTCRFIDRCAMFPLFRSRAALNVYKLAYCERRYKTCARYELASTGAMPDKALLPDGTMLPAHWVDPEG